MKTVKALMLLSLTLCLFTSCYRMPTDDDYCVIPTTNNPDVNNAQSASFMPSVGY